MAPCTLWHAITEKTVTDNNRRLPCFASVIAQVFQVMQVIPRRSWFQHMWGGSTQVA